MIDIRDVTFCYGKNKILDNVNLHIEPKSLTALIGLNGAGKSTMFGCLLKQNKINAGTITVYKKNIEEYSFSEYAKIVSVVPQLSLVNRIDYKVRDFLVEGRTPYLSGFAVPGEKEYSFSEKIAIEMGVDKYLNTNFLKLSGGEQQLVLIARALVQDTPIILFDEPMSALDLKNQAFLLRIIKRLSEEGKTIIFSTHNPNHAMTLACNVCVIHENKILDYGNVSKVISGDVINKMYGKDIFLCENEGVLYCEIKKM